MNGLQNHPGVAVLSDEIYDTMTYDGEEHCSLLTFEAIRDRLIVLNGWSKTWAMTGWRMGWSIWPETLYDKVRKLAVNCWSCVNAPAQFAGIAAIRGPQGRCRGHDPGVRQAARCRRGGVEHHSWHFLRHAQRGILRFRQCP